MPDIAIPVGSLVITGFKPSVGYGGPPTGSLVFQGYEPAVNIDSASNPTIQIPAGQLQLTGSVPITSYGAPSTGSIAFQGHPPTLSISSSSGGLVLIVIPAGELRFVTYYPDVVFGPGPAAGQLRFTGYVPTLITTIAGDQTIQVPAGTLSVAGRTLSLVTVTAGNITIQIPAGRIGFSGYPASTTRIDQPVYEVRIEGKFGGVWTSMQSDTLKAMRWERGNQGLTPKDTVAVTGTMSFTLRNEDGRYSPNSPFRRPDFDFGLPVRVIYNYQGVDYVRWVGKLRTIDPTPGLYGERVTRCVAVDAMNDLAETRVRELTVQFEQSETALLNEIFDVLPADAQPTDRQFDTGLDNYPVAFDDIGEGTSGLSLVERIVTSARGRLFVRGDGTMIYRNRDSISLTLPIAGFEPTDIVIRAPSDLSNVFNNIWMVGHPKTFSDGIIVLATHDGPLSLEPDESQEIFLSYRDPDNPDKSIGGYEQLLPQMIVDYIWNSMDRQRDVSSITRSGSTATVSLSGHGLATGDFVVISGADQTEYNGQVQVTVVDENSFTYAVTGSPATPATGTIKIDGIDVSADVSIDADFFVTTVKLTITNNGSATVHKRHLQTRGIGIFSYDPVKVQSYTARSYGNREITIDLPYQDDISVLKPAADFLKATYIDLSDQITDIQFLAQKKLELLELVMRLEIADVVAAGDPQILPAGAFAFINWIQVEHDQDGVIMMRLRTAPWVVDPVLFSEVVTLEDTLDVTFSPPESRIDVALIDQSEVS